MRISLLCLTLLALGSAPVGAQEELFPIPNTEDAKLLWKKLQGQPGNPVGDVSLVMKELPMERILSHVRTSTTAAFHNPSAQRGFTIDEMTAFMQLGTLLMVGGSLPAAASTLLAYAWLNRALELVPAGPEHQHLLRARSVIVQGLTPEQTKKADSVLNSWVKAH